MFGRVLCGGIGAIVALGAALVLGYRGYQAYLEWLVAGTRRPEVNVAASGAQND